MEKTAKGALLQKYHAGVKGFFKDEEAVRMFDKMEGVEERLEFIWRSQAMQVRAGVDYFKYVMMFLMEKGVKWGSV